MQSVLIGVGSDSRMAKALERHLNRGFASRGYRAVGFDAGPAALSEISDLKEREEQLALVVADQDAPGMSGLSILREARRLHPEVRTVLVCPHEDLAKATEALNAGLLDHFLIKPFDGERDLLPDVSDLLESWEGARDRDADSVRIVGARESAGAHQIRRFLDGNQIHYQWLTPTSESGAALLERVPEPPENGEPVAIFADGEAVAGPTSLDLARHLGISSSPERDHYDLVVVGGGPAGLASAVYGASEGLETVIIEREAPGGQAGLSNRIENYLGFHSGLSGADLSRRALIQARRFGAEIVRPSEVKRIERAGEDIALHLGDGTTITSKGIVIATGASYRRLTAPGVEDLVGRGIYYGASAREARDRVGQHVLIVGGANSAGQAALNFADYADRVTMLIRGKSLDKGMSKYLVDRIERAENIEVLTGTELAAAHGEVSLESVTLKRDGEVIDAPVPADAVFVYIGAMPHTEDFRDVLPADDRGFLLTGAELGGRPPDWPLRRDPFPLESSIDSVLVAGDCRHGSTKRVAAAVGEGSMAVQLMHQCLKDRHRV